MLTIQPQYLTLSKLLDGRLFRIPEYQRAYSWTIHERRDRFDDIEKTFAKGPDDGHFMAAVVCLHRKKQTLGTDEFHMVEVVDGQQRLTTLIILLNCIKLALDRKDKAEAKLERELSELLVKSEGDELLLLQTNHDTSHYFENFLRKGTAPSSTEAKTLADRELLAALEDCRDFVDAWEDSDRSLASLLGLLKNRLFFLLHQIDEEKAVYTVFEVLNSRGLDVSWFDRLKSILMGSAFDLKNARAVVKDLHRTWRDIYSVIGLRQGLSTEALRFAATLRASDPPSRPLGEQDSVELVRLLAGNAKSIREVASWLLQVTEACDKVVKNPRINAVTRIAQARLLATAIFLRDDIAEKDRTSLLRAWERVSFRIYGMLGKDARTRVGDCVRLAWDVVNRNLAAPRIEEGIAKIGADFTVSMALDALKDGDRYEGWEIELRYFMYRYEESLSSSQGLKFKNSQWEKIWMVSPVESIEHIWARSKARPRVKDSLGNLVLLPPRLNSALQDKTPKDKVDAYRKTGLLIAGEVADLIEEFGWTATAIKEREKQLLEWAAEEWAD